MSRAQRGGAGSTTPVTPAPSALRSNVPTLWGSVTPSSTNKKRRALASVRTTHRGRDSTNESAWARTPWGASVRAACSKRPLGTRRTGTLRRAASRSMSSSTGSGVEPVGDPHLAHGAPPGRQQLPHRLAAFDLLASETGPIAATSRSGRLPSPLAQSVHRWRDDRTCLPNHHVRAVHRWQSVGASAVGCTCCERPVAEHPGPCALRAVLRSR